jgi:hypothetical protein
MRTPYVCMYCCTGSWIADFKADSCAAAEAVTPVGGCILKKSMAQEA